LWYYRGGGRLMKVVVALAFVLVTAAGAGMLLDRIAAVVDDRVITASKVDARAAPEIATLVERYSGEELARRVQEVRRKTLDALIDEELLIAEAKKQQIEPKASAVAERMQSYRAQFATEEEFIRELESQGLSMNRFREIVKEAVMMEELIRVEIRSSLTVGLGEVERYYAANSAQFSSPDRYWLSKLSASGEGAGELAVTLAERARAGETFEKLAGEAPAAGLSIVWSQLGEFTAADMSLQIQQAVTGLVEGGVSAPFNVGNAWVILRVDKFEPGYTPPLSEIRDEVKQQLIEDKVAAKKDAWFSKLRESAYIDVRL